MKALLIAEKPSLMREIKAAYEGAKGEFDFQIDFLAQAGHLVGLRLPNEINPAKYGKWSLANLPIDVPYEYKILDGKGELVGRIREAIRSGQYDFVIHAGDPDGEGELLVRLVLDFVGNTLPVKRFWSNDITHPAIVRALHHLEDDAAYDPIYHAAHVRQHSDYQFGMNITSAATLKLGTLCKLGRVKAPIIRMIVDREREIRSFVESSTFKPSFVWNSLEFVCEEQFKTAEEALASMPSASDATVASAKTERKSQAAPKLYKLSTLQSDAHKAIKFSAAHTLEVLQSLYEAKLVSYPRTDCEFISSGVDIESIVGSIAPMLSLNAGDLLKRADAVRGSSSYLNDKAIASEGHTAIIPTGQRPSQLSKDEASLYELICRRFLAIFAPAKETIITTVVANPDGKPVPGPYVLKEYEDVVPGWELIMNPAFKARVSSGVSFKEGQALTPIKLQAKECKAKPPVRYNDGSLIKALDHPESYVGDDDKKVAYKIGTPATRANIIEECVRSGYFTKEKGAFVPTKLAEIVVDALGFVSLFDVTESGRWESMLESIRRGEVDYRAVEAELLKECQEVTEEIKAKHFEVANTPGGAGAEVLGKCPKCGSDVVKGKFGAYCAGKCGMQVGKAMGKALTDAQIKSMLAGKKTLVKGLTSKAGKRYDAYLQPKGVTSFSYVNKAGKQVTGYGFDIEMSFPPRKDR